MPTPRSAGSSVLHDDHHHHIGFGLTTGMPRSAATYMLAQGVPLVAVSRVVGHSSSTITGSLYNHTVADDAAVFMERADDRPTRLRAVPWQSPWQTGPGTTQGTYLIDRCPGHTVRHQGLEPRTR